MNWYKMNAIGGFFELEINSSHIGLYPDLIPLNTGRNAFEYILRVRKYKKIYIPYFTCNVLLEPLQKLNIDYEFYDVDDSLEAIFDFSIIKENEGFLITNYFGIKNEYIKRISQYVKNTIIDNAQALFSIPIENTDTFYSPRKFVGVADGSFVAITDKLQDIFETDQSFERFSHLIKRIDLSPEEAYADFQTNDNSLKNLPIMQMSKLTQRLLLSINFEEIKKKRLENFHYLHQRLKERNNLEISLNEGDIPMVYPFRTKYAFQLKKYLIENKVFSAMYWPNVLNWCSDKNNAYKLTEEILALPIDQRYNDKDMNRIINLITNFNF